MNETFLKFMNYSSPPCIAEIQTLSQIELPLKNEAQLITYMHSFFLFIS